MGERAVRGRDRWPEEPASTMICGWILSVSRLHFTALDRVRNAAAHGRWIIWNADVAK